MDHHAPFTPLAKEDVANLFGVTTRTIENWIEDEGMPAPACIGNRVFWHPDVFYAWLDKRLRIPKADTRSAPPVDIKLKQRPAAGAVHGRLRHQNAKRLAEIEAGTAS
ncbi:DNA-binding protein [Aquabacterium soli]|uniref:DNA-binding protein n=1 Tax=Aquabacterium soli TaxID=2493092 RepID=A0A3R8YJU5_9BURK|nr:helix-turn-helix domain-containing protein [Aquabacterium soli]RRS01081.1 DNA-binding protein [Aquabacterium soli]